jgi:hypothetical protein
MNAVAMSNVSSTIWRKHCNRKIYTKIKRLITEIQLLCHLNTYARTCTYSTVDWGAIHIRFTAAAKHKPEFRIRVKVVPVLN